MSAGGPLRGAAVGSGAGGVSIMGRAFRRFGARRTAAVGPVLLLLAAGAAGGPPAPPAAEDPGFGPARTPRSGNRAIPPAVPDPRALEGFAGELVLRPLRSARPPAPPPVSAEPPGITPDDLVPGRSDARAARARARAERARGPERELLLRMARHHETGTDAPEIERLAGGVLVVRFPAAEGTAGGPDSFAVDPAAPAGLRVYRLAGPPPERSGSTAPDAKP